MLGWARAMTTATVRHSTIEGKPFVSVIYEFSPEDSPKLPDGNLEVIAEWRRPNKPPVPEPDFKVIKWGRTRVRDPKEGDWPEDDKLTRGADVTMPRRFYEGVVRVELKWNAATPSADQGTARSHELVETVGSPVNEETTVEQPRIEPQMAKLLLAPLDADEAKRITTTDPVPGAAARFVFRGNQVLVILNHIHARLQAGLGGFWYAQGPQARDPSGRRALSEVPDDELDVLTEDQREECWAQLIAEMVLGTAYQGPGSYLAMREIGDTKRQPPLAPSPAADSSKWHPVHRQDARWFQLVREAALKDDLVFSPVYACQQLSTAIVMSRSETFYSLADDPLDSGQATPNGKIAAAKAVAPSKKDAEGKELNPGFPRSAAALAEKGWLVPGACYYRTVSTRHVSCVIRAYAANRFQLVDTDGWNVEPNPFGIPPTDPPGTKDRPARSGVNFDTKATDRLSNAFFSVVVPEKVPKEDMITAMKRLRLSRTLTFLRLVILLRGSGGDVTEQNVLWVSKRLHPHEVTESGFLHYPPARLLASLRGCPHADQLAVRWQVFAPLGDETVVDAIGTGRTERWWERQDAEGNPIAKSRLVIEFEVRANGVPRVRQRSRQSGPREPSTPKFLDELEALSTITPEQRAKFPELADVDNGSHPDYFKK